MLQLMRKHARNWLMKVVLGIIIIVFVFYFGSMRGLRIHAGEAADRNHRHAGRLTNSICVIQNQVREPA
ncbi:MAG: SurA N-terminal domain-containing protein [Deltaproteobacteria bacterium]|nr:SurA N-terminal domain-containing protein [Deltaproteobacteria bacterium]